MPDTSADRQAVTAAGTANHRIEQPRTTSTAVRAGEQVDAGRHERAGRPHQRAATAAGAGHRARDTEGRDDRGQPDRGTGDHPHAVRGPRRTGSSRTRLMAELARLSRLSRRRSAVRRSRTSCGTANQNASTALAEAQQVGGGQAAKRATRTARFPLRRGIGVRRRRAGWPAPGAGKGPRARRTSGGPVTSGASRSASAAPALPQAATRTSRLLARGNLVDAGGVEQAGGDQAGRAELGGHCYHNHFLVGGRERISRRHHPV